ncbi:bifunctional glutamate--cysteine ligase GshA/glutathione synthetase GshB [Gorillibacterium sp. CAU 1737]|uniref:bifunctional glutamate--cysteine ligase GshA/glutathione synthetase GshB n=1 Tax=Gorillibacterium sp. CAU 1737 TaxID=3140362 RepID=UPI00326020C7
MARLDRDVVRKVIQQVGAQELFKGKFGLEIEHARIDRKGRLAMTPHPAAFGSKTSNPYIQTDFSESQIELITPAFASIDETHHFLEALQDIVTEELEKQGEWLWPSSNPPILPDEPDIPIARMNDAVQDQYRRQLAVKYGRKRQLLSGIHYNFSFDEGLMKKLLPVLSPNENAKDFSNSVYLKLARNLLKYRWLLVYLTGASPVFDKTYIEQCVAAGLTHDEKSYSFPHLNSLRNSPCGYRNEKPLYVSFESVEDYVRDLGRLIDEHTLSSVKEFYSPVRLKAGGSEQPMQQLLEGGIAYLELRFLDLSPLEKSGISKETMKLIHLFLLFMLLKVDEPFGIEEQAQAQANHDRMIAEGLDAILHGEGEAVTMREEALHFLQEMKEMVQLLEPDNEEDLRLVDAEMQKVLHPERCFASILKEAIQKTSYMNYHLVKANEYAHDSLRNGYRFKGYEDLELSTQLLLKAAVKRGISFQLVDRKENFVLLRQEDRREYVKQATKTSLDSYSTVLMMENKSVTKNVLKEQGLPVPDGVSFESLEEAVTAYGVYREKAIVIKPKSTNFGLGITIFPNGFTQEEYRRACELAFEHDQTILLESFVAGKEYRFLVMGDEVVGILHRVPANVTGDGVRTIEELVHEKNKDPLRGKGYKTPLEKIQLGEAEEMFLRNRSRKWTDIPEQGEVVYLRENSNISTGGDSIDYTDLIPESYKQIAVRAAQAVGASICGVDMMIEDIQLEATDSGFSIIELNFNPAIHIHCYPYQGKNRRADDKILDLLFGEVQSLE